MNGALVSIETSFKNTVLLTTNFLTATNKKCSCYISICDVYNKTLDFMYAYIKWKFRTIAASDYANVVCFLRICNILLNFTVAKSANYVRFTMNKHMTIKNMNNNSTVWMQAHPESAKNSYWEPAEACLTSVETEIALLHYNMRCLPS